VAQPQGLPAAAGAGCPGNSTSSAFGSAKTASAQEKKDALPDQVVQGIVEG
jgi:hypothetical protein